MSFLKFGNESGKISPQGIFSEDFILDGITRPALRFRFEDNAPYDIRDLSEMFAPHRCKILTIIEEDGDKFIYENYDIRAKVSLGIENLKDNEGNFIQKEVVDIIMVKRTPLELAYEKLITELEETQLAILDNDIECQVKIYTNLILKEKKSFKEIPEILKE